MVQKPDTLADQPTDIDQDVQAASRSTTDFIQNVAPVQAQKRKSRSSRKLFIVLVVLVILGVGGYFLSSLFRKSPEKAEKSSPQTSQADKHEEAESHDGLKKYSSTSLKLSFEYPEGWQVNDDQPNEVKLESPATKLPGSSGQEVNATIVMTIVPSSTDLSDFPEDKATGVRPSEKFAYKSPAVDQRQETFLSFMNLSGASEGLNAVFITGDASYTKGDPVKKADFEKIKPVIWLEFHDEAGQKVTVTADAWSTNPVLQSAFTVLKSFSIK